MALTASIQSEHFQPNTPLLAFMNGVLYKEPKNHAQ
jgi:hypothetical protein